MAKKFTITNAGLVFSQSNSKRGLIYPDTFEINGEEDMQVSDGYHTMDELYEHRIALWIALCKVHSTNGDDTTSLPIWRSKLHDDGSEYEGWFVLGIGKEKGEIMTYHLPLSKWDETNFAETLDRAPEFDGHTPADVLERLKNL